LEAVYAGEFSDARIRVDPSVRQVKRFDRLLEIAGETLLETRYPRFAEVAPRKILPSPRLYQQLLEGFVAAGTLPLAEARSRSLSTLIDGLATPLGLVETKRGAYVFSPDASGYPLIPHLLSLLSSSGPTPMAKALDGLTGSPFGLPHDTAVFLISALVIGGILGARKSGRAIPLDYLNMQSVEKAEEITLGELLAEEDRETLLNECLFLSSVAGLQTFGLRQQREVWKEVMKLRDSALQLVEEVRRSLGRMVEFSSFQGFGLTHVERTLTAVTTLAESIKVSYPAKEGLEAFLRAWRGTGLTGSEVISLRKLSKFLAEKAEEFIFIAHYLRHPAVEKAAARDEKIAELRATAVALLEAPEAGVVSDGGEHLAAVFGQLRELYAALYARKHTEFYQARKLPNIPRTAQRALETLSALTGVETLDRPAGLDAFLRDLTAGESAQCGRQISEELLRSPLCGCGFAPGNAPPQRRVENPAESIDGFLGSYCGILASPRVAEAISARAFALQDVKASSADRLKRLADILHRGGVSPAELAGAIDEGTAVELGRALSGRIPLRPRSLAELAGKLAGRRLPPRSILSLVSEWMSETSDDALISVEPDLPGGPHAADTLGAESTAAHVGRSTASFWPLLHGGLFAHASPAAAAGGEILEWEKRLEEAFPSTRLREVFLSADTEEVARFIRSETLHTAAVRAAWLVLAERVADGRGLPPGFSPASRHADPEKARRIRDLLASLLRAAGALTMPYPERLSVRIAFEELLFDPWATDELSSAIYRSLEKVSGEADSWLAGLHPVEAVPLSGSPMVCIADGVPADVWMEAARIDGEKGVLAGAEKGWARLETPPLTQESIASLFVLKGDPQEQLGLRDVPVITVRGNEERPIAESLPPPEPGKPTVIRFTLFDKAAHTRRLRLSEMASILAGILGRDLPAVVRQCMRQKRALILTTDHGQSLSRDGLSHGKGGAYERLIFRARWPAP
jgi:hypothetical protein